MTQSLVQAITATLRYARFFSFPLTLTELHHWLISPHPVALSRLKQALPALPQSLRRQVLLHPNRLRHQRAATSQAKFDHLQPYLHLLQLLPSIRLIAATGSLSMANARPEDDIDLMIITKTHTLWLTRPLVTLILALVGKRRPPASTASHPNALCVNLWLDTSALVVPASKRNLYTAHEVLQIKPLLDRGDTYQRFLRANLWASHYLANAYESLVSAFPRPEARERGNPIPMGWVRAILLPLDLFLALLNLFAFLAQYLYMKRHLTREHVTPHMAYFHPRDLAPRLTRYLQQSL